MKFKTLALGALFAAASLTGCKSSDKDNAKMDAAMVAKFKALGYSNVQALGNYGDMGLNFTDRGYVLSQVKGKDTVRFIAEVAPFNDYTIKSIKPMTPTANVNVTP